MEQTILDDAEAPTFKPSTVSKLLAMSLKDPAVKSWFIVLPYLSRTTSRYLD